MAKPNYNFAKRQRELAKKAKKEEKQQRKAVEGNVAEAGSADADKIVTDGLTESAESGNSAQ